ncbi:hypothetical protein Celaphus_00002454 [Cervus elaphus hippelaphus]|uniref:Uncharacterized protein n=1 Tax=Cervus elaphus hippelaphus TaxID=46360 RepID=A0A212CH28_CEREH|nr:hypothetical protein Celaphus_00002454 [Cervus elaphus hippelaphus]
MGKKGKASSEPWETTAQADISTSTIWQHWYDVKTLAMFNIRNTGKTLVTRTQGNKISSDDLKDHQIQANY